MFLYMFHQSYVYMCQPLLNVDFDYNSLPIKTVPELNSLFPTLLDIFSQYTIAHAGDSSFVNLSIDQQVPESAWRSARRYAL